LVVVVAGWDRASGLGTRGLVYRIVAVAVVVVAVADIVEGEGCTRDEPAAGVWRRTESVREMRLCDMG
jgi:hypothetical protein